MLNKQAEKVENSEDATTIIKEYEKYDLNKKEKTLFLQRIIKKKFSENLRRRKIFSSW